MSIFSTVVKKLKTKDEVDAVFVTGSYGLVDLIKQKRY